MSEQQEIVSPTDSASNIARKKSRPGKAQRNASRSSAPSVASASTAPSSMPLAMQFARKASYAPTPQPGKYPIVFPTGAGEPTRDSFMALDGDSLTECFAEMSENFSKSEKFAEFAQNADYSDGTFKKELTTAIILALAQQIVHAHQNLGLPTGDFASVSSTDIMLMNSIQSVINQFGEFSEEFTGTRYLYKDYVSEVTALIRTAAFIAAQNGSKVDTDLITTVLRMHWLPAKSNDKRTAFIVAHKIRGYFQKFGITLEIEDLTSAVFNEEYEAFTIAKQVLPEDKRDMFNLIFSGYTTEAEFTGKFRGTNSKPEVLDELGLFWPDPKAGHLRWKVMPKVDFPELAEGWIRKKPTIAKFFHVSSGLAQKSEASGTAAQFADRQQIAGVTVLKAKVALSAPQFSLLSCFPATVFDADVTERRVTLTTSIPVKTRAIEFQLQDWRG